MSETGMHGMQGADVVRSGRGEDVDPVEDYLRHARRYRRGRMRRAAGVMVAGAVICGFLITRMSDIGHAVGFAGLGLALLVGAGVVARGGRG